MGYSTIDSKKVGFFNVESAKNVWFNDGNVYYNYQDF